MHVRKTREKQTGAQKEKYALTSGGIKRSFFFFFIISRLLNERFGMRASQYNSSLAGSASRFGICTY
jgi:hypothetical protein